MAQVELGLQGETPGNYQHEVLHAQQHRWHRPIRNMNTSTAAPMLYACLEAHA